MGQPEGVCHDVSYRPAQIRTRLRRLGTGATRMLVSGATEQEAIENIQDAIREYLAVVEDEIRGQDVREIEVAV